MNNEPPYPRPETQVIVESRDDWSLSIVAALDSSARWLITLVVVLDGLVLAVLTFADPQAPLRANLFLRWLVGVTVIAGLAALLAAVDALAPLRFDLVTDDQLATDWPAILSAPGARKRLVRYKAFRVRLAALFFMIALFVLTLALLVSLL